MMTGTDYQMISCLASGACCIAIARSEVGQHLPANSVQHRVRSTPYNRLSCCAREIVAPCHGDSDPRLKVVPPVKLNARYVSIGDFDDLYFQVLFENRHPAADYDPSATEPYLLLQRQFEDDDRGLCYLETRDIDRFAGHYRLRLIEFAPTRLAFEIDRPEDRTVEVTYKLSTRRFRQVRRIVHIIFGVEP